MRRVPNLPALHQPNGKTYDVAPEAGAAPRPYSLAEWVDLALGNLPQGHLTMADGVKAYAIMQACNRAKPDGVLELDDDYYDWLLRILFSDDECKRLGVKLADGSELTGAFVLNVFGFVAVAMENALKQMQPAEATAPAPAGDS